MSIISALQLGSAPDGTAATLDKLQGWRAAVRESGSRLVVLPEALLGGYPKGQDFGARIGYRTPAGRERFAQYWNEAIALDGPEVRALGRFAHACDAAVVAGVIERDAATLYCSALFFAADGSLLATHRKLMPTASERLIWGQGDGSTLPVVETPAGRVGAAICWENYMPLLRAAMYAKGLDIWCAPTVDERDTWQASMRHIACESRCFVVSACQYLPPEPGGDRPLIRGGSTIISPLGETLADPLYGEEGLVSAVIDARDLVRARFDFDPVGHYARPDIFALSVDESPRGVRFHSGTSDAPDGADPD